MRAGAEWGDGVGARADLGVGFSDSEWGWCGDVAPVVGVHHVYNLQWS